jgi:hypothetical protein
MRRRDVAPATVFRGAHATSIAFDERIGIDRMVSFVLESGSIEPIDVLRRVAADSVAEIYFIEADDRIRYGPAFPGSNPALTFSPSAEPTSAAAAGQEHILEQEDGKKRWVQVVTELSRAFALCAASDEATAIRDDVSFFQALASKRTLKHVSGITHGLFLDG